MTESIKYTTSGEWIVSTNNNDEIVVNALNAHGSVIKTIGVFGSIDMEGEEENIANAALVACSKDMLDALIHIQSELMTSKETIDLEMVNEMISEILSKLANEADEEKI